MPLLLDDLLLQVTTNLSADPRAGNTQEMLDIRTAGDWNWETKETRRRSAGSVAKIWPLEELLDERTITNSLIEKEMRATWPNSGFIVHLLSRLIDLNRSMSACACRHQLTRHFRLNHQTCKKCFERAILRDAADLLKINDQN